MENSIEVPCCGQLVHTICLARSFSSRGVDCPFCNQSLAEFARSSSFLASSLFHGCMVDLDRPPSNQISNFWMTVGWSGLLFTRQPMAPRHGSLSGSASLVERPLRCLTFLHWTQHRVLSVPFQPPSCLTDPLAAQFVSVSPVSVWCRTRPQLPLQWCLLHHPTLTFFRPIGSRMVRCRVSIHCVVGAHVAPVLQILGPRLGSSAH